MDREKTIGKIRAVLQRNGVKKAYLFGSFARGGRKFNDIDVAIVPPKGKFSLLDLIGLEQEISRCVRRKIDLLTLRSISPYMMPYIKKDLVAI